MDGRLFTVLSIAGSMNIRRFGRSENSCADSVVAQDERKSGGREDRMSDVNSGDSFTMVP